jgi:hypothetical protein
MVPLSDDWLKAQIERYRAENEAEAAFLQTALFLSTSELLVGGQTACGRRLPWPSRLLLGIFRLFHRATPQPAWRVPPIYDVTTRVSSDREQPPAVIVIGAQPTKGD